MYINEDNIKSYYKLVDLNNFHCPICSVGILKCIPEKFTFVQSENSKNTPPTIEDKDGLFTGVLKCAEEMCNNTVAFVGDYKRTKKIKGGQQVWIRTYSPLFFNPPIPIFELNLFEDSISTETYDMIGDAFMLFWADTNSCINKIRIALEEILTDKGIRKTEINSKRKRIKISLNKRIELFQEKYPEIGESLMAIKWIGNEGSHSSEVMSNEAVFSAFKILEHTLESLYGTTLKEIKSLTKSINKHKRLK